MKSTIGEVVNEIIQYSNKIEMSIVNELPFIKVYLSGKNNTTKAIMYIIQVGNHVYSICDDYDYPIGERFFPTGNITNPFITEKEIVLGWFNNDSNIRNIINMKNNITYDSLIEYIYNRLWYYDIIRFNPECRKIKFSELGFTSNKIRNIIDKSFIANNCKNGTIDDLIRLINNESKTFSLYGLR